MMHTRKAFAILALVLLGSGGALAALNFRPSAADMAMAANDFLGGLSGEQRSQATMPFDDPGRLDWHFIPKEKRKGLQVKHMDEKQRQAAHRLLESAVSQLGYKKARTIMTLEAILRELEKGRQGTPLRDPERYYFTVFGKPAGEGRWGWSVEGHHLSLNFVVDDGKLASVTPAFYGANPAEVRSDLDLGPKRGTRVLAAEEDRAFELLRSLSGDRRQKAVIAEKAPAEIRAAGEPRPPHAAPEGLPASEMTDEQVETLRSLIEAYTDNMLSDQAERRLAEISEADIKKVYFAWAGAEKPGIGHYYRVQGPTFLIEFINNQPDGSGNPANHIHSVWRQLKGDFGQDN